MLIYLRIRDLAIIDAAEVAFLPGFTVITGETGAGKSILVDALTLALGGRAHADLVRTGAAEAQVEALFQVDGHPEIQARLRQRDLVGDDPQLLLIRRVIGARGRSRVVINGQLATVATLTQLVRGLVDISGQHEQQSLLMVANHLDILDRFGDLLAERAAYGRAYAQLRRQRREARRCQEGQQAQEAQRLLVQTQLAELTELAPQPGEDLALAQEVARLEHAERLREGATRAEEALYGGDASAFEQISGTTQLLLGLARLDPSLQPLGASLAALGQELQDTARQLQRYGSRLEPDPARLEAVGTRLADLRRLSRQHGGDLAHLLRRQAELAALWAQLQEGGTGGGGGAAALSEQEGLVQAQAQALSAARARAAIRLGAAIEAEVAEMELPGATFRVQQVAGELTEAGLDQVEFVWSANPGEALRPLVRIASGGELSRLMLAVKGVLRSRDLVSVYVFDEVDMGLGGAAADSIGRKIARVARGQQALTITHLAPIAARADQHLRVRKRAAAKGAAAAVRTVSQIDAIDGQARAEEIARMIDGAAITPVTREAARAMLARRLAPPPRARRARTARRRGVPPPT